jgi:predicted Zn-dependent protease
MGYYLLVKRIQKKLITVLILAISSGLLVVLGNFPVHANSNVHPLPATLSQWRDSTNSGDYFDQVKPVKVGYLIWSLFPVKVKIEIPTGLNEAETHAWMNKVAQAVQEWSVYLPLKIVEQAESADITIWRKSPPMKPMVNGEFPRARSALTTYELYNNNNNNILSHRFTILLSPSQTSEYVLAAARHELGHALGIWGHSPLQTDALYFSQVRNSPPISVRDVNTLKRVYQQPTTLGWSR